MFSLSAKLNKIMEGYDVFVSVKPKPKQPSKVCRTRPVIIMSLVIITFTLTKALKENKKAVKER